MFILIIWDTTSYMGTMWHLHGDCSHSGRLNYMTQTVTWMATCYHARHIDKEI